MRNVKHRSVRNSKNLAGEDVKQIVWTEWNVPTTTEDFKNLLEGKFDFGCHYFDNMYDEMEVVVTYDGDSKGEYVKVLGWQAMMIGGAKLYLNTKATPKVGEISEDEINSFLLLIPDLVERAKLDAKITYGTAKNRKSAIDYLLSLKIA